MAVLPVASTVAKACRYEYPASVTGVGKFIPSQGTWKCARTRAVECAGTNMILSME